MIVLDTHIWVWWIHGERLSPEQLERLSGFEEEGLGVSIFSCWEVAKLVERGRLKLRRSVEEWFASPIRARSEAERHGVLVVDLEHLDRDLVL